MFRSAAWLVNFLDYSFSKRFLLYMKIQFNFLQSLKLQFFHYVSYCVFAEDMRNRPFWYCNLDTEVPVAESQCNGWWAVAALELDAAARGCAHKTLLSVHPSLLIGAKRRSGCHPGGHPRRFNPCYIHQKSRLCAQNVWLRGGCTLCVNREYIPNCGI